MNKETKQESSIPVQYRVSIVTLAGLAKYWESQGENIRTISQLSAWSMYLLSEILSSNGLYGEEMGVAEARNYLMQKGLYQKSSNDRSRMKIVNAIRFEGMRKEGYHPSGGRDESDPVVRRDYNIMHRQANPYTGKESTVEPFMGKIEDSKINDGVEIFLNIKDDQTIPRVYNGGPLREMPAFKLGKGDMPKEEFNERESIRAERDRLQQEEMDKFLASRKKE